MSLNPTVEKLSAVGVQTLGVVGTAADRARRYFSHRRPCYPVAADPDLVSHRAFGVPRRERTEEFVRVVRARLDGLAREAGIGAPPGGGWEALDREDGIAPAEFASAMARPVQLTAQFLIDRQGVIRWSHIETERDGLEGVDRFPSDDELLAAARVMSA